MTDWQEGNNAYLSAALTWLNLCLKQFIQPNAASQKPYSETSPPAQNWFAFKRQEKTTATSSLPLLSAGTDNIVLAEKAMHEAEELNPPPALLHLKDIFGLSPFEQNILLLCAGMELDTRVAGLCASIQGDNRPYPTFGLALTLFNDSSWDALAADSPLRFWRLIEINQPAAQPLTASALRADERIINYIKGLNSLDDRFTSLLMPLNVGDEVKLPPSQASTVETLLRRLGQAEYRPPVVQLIGADSLSKQLVAVEAASALGLHLYRLPAQYLPTSATELETFARLWWRESALVPVALYLDAHEIDKASGNDTTYTAVTQYLERNRSVLFLDTREVWVGTNEISVNLEVSPPTPAEQRIAWTVELGEKAATDLPARLAAQFSMNLSTIQQITRAAREDDSQNSDTLEQEVWGLCLNYTRPGLDTLAQRVDAKATWKDMVLAEEDLALLGHIVDQVQRRSLVYEVWGFGERMNRGLGISVLFAGESGTGKTMAAEVIANALRLNLYKIDLSAVVSKYIGETEKNLRRVFDAAEHGGAVLFFDEADSLFGKRSEVKDSHDRYANIEINYLLQRIESYRGLAILATNMKSALDAAFLRRLRFIVNFGFPGPAERRAIWQRAFPPQTPVEALDYDRLARLSFTGGNIHNIALNAAFMAAAAGQSVTMPIVLAAARIEFLKLEHPINEADFHWQTPNGAHA